MLTARNLINIRGNINLVNPSRIPSGWKLCIKHHDLPLLRTMTKKTLLQNTSSPPPRLLMHPSLVRHRFATSCAQTFRHIIYTSVYTRIISTRMISCILKFATNRSSSAQDRNYGSEHGPLKHHVTREAERVIDNAKKNLLFCVAREVVFVPNLQQHVLVTRNSSGPFTIEPGFCDQSGAVHSPLEQKWRYHLGERSKFLPATSYTARLTFPTTWK